MYRTPPPQRYGVFSLAETDELPGLREHPNLPWQNPVPSADEGLGNNPHGLAGFCDVAIGIAIAAPMPAATSAVVASG